MSKDVFENVPWEQYAIARSQEGQEPSFDKPLTVQQMDAVFKVVTTCLTLNSNVVDAGSEAYNDMKWEAEGLLSKAFAGEDGSFDNEGYINAAMLALEIFRDIEKTIYPFFNASKDKKL